MTRELLLGLLAFLPLACRGSPEAPSPAPTPSAMKASSASVPLPTVPALRPRLSLPTSPYAASLDLTFGNPALLTAEAVYLLEPSEPRRFALGSGQLGALTDGSVVRWDGGQLWRFPWSQNRWSPVVPLSQAPQRLVANAHAVAWVSAGEGSTASLWASAGQQPRQLASAADGIAAIALRDDQVFFAEELPGGSWRLGAVSLEGEPARYGEVRSGRTPAMLVVTSDVFFYDGPTLSVYRSSTDLRRTERVGQDVICSPLAVADNVYCAQPPGAIVELSLSGGPARVVATPRGGTVTALTATSTEVTWLREDGKGLAIESVSL